MLASSVGLYRIFGLEFPTTVAGLKISNRLIDLNGHPSDVVSSVLLYKRKSFNFKLVRNRSFTVFFSGGWSPKSDPFDGVCSIHNANMIQVRLQLE